jgi:hypothetical protein
MTDKINNLETHIKNKNTKNLYAGINEFKKGYKPGTNLVKDEKFDLFEVSHNIFIELLLSAIA